MLYDILNYYNCTSVPQTKKDNTPVAKISTGLKKSYWGQCKKLMIKVTSTTRTS